MRARIYQMPFNRIKQRRGRPTLFFPSPSVALRPPTRENKSRIFATARVRFARRQSHTKSPLSRVHPLPPPPPSLPFAPSPPSYPFFALPGTLPFSPLSSSLASIFAHHLAAPPPFFSSFSLSCPPTRLPRCSARSI